MQTVCTNHQVVAPALAIGECHLGVIVGLLDRRESAAQMHCRAGRARGVRENPREHGPHDCASAGHIWPGEARRRQCGHNRPVGESKLHVVGGAAVLQEGIEDAEMAECPQGGGGQADSRAIVAPARVDLHQVDVDAILPQRNRGGHPREAAADDQDAPSARSHFEVPLTRTGSGARTTPHAVRPPSVSATQSAM